jgi:hypothetical protein
LAITARAAGLSLPSTKPGFINAIAPPPTASTTAEATPSLRKERLFSLGFDMAKSFQIGVILAQL